MTKKQRSIFEYLKNRFNAQEIFFCYSTDFSVDERGNEYHRETIRTVSFIHPEHGYHCFRIETFPFGEWAEDITRPMA